MSEQETAETWRELDRLATLLRAEILAGNRPQIKAILSKVEAVSWQALCDIDDEGGSDAE